MLQSYDDILTMMTRLVRRSHYYHYLHMDEGHEGAHPECKSFSYDVLGKRDEFSPDGERCCSCVAKPGWWDENGTPRFAPHHPKLCPDIYADEVALILISCQACGAEYPVQMSWSLSGQMMMTLRVLAGYPQVELPKPDLEELKKTSLSARVAAGSIHFGDPPCFHGGCTAGATMNCWDLKVLEFWRRDLGVRDWARVPELEIDLPDMKDPDRTGEAQP